jgi:hypothetical protein
LIWRELKNEVQTLKVVQWTFKPQARLWDELAFGYGISKFHRRLTAMVKSSGQTGKREILSISWRKLHRTEWLNIPAWLFERMANSDKRWREIEDSIRQVLLRDWDPIGVGDAKGARDEYNGYIQPIYWMLMKSRSEDEIAKYLRTTKTKDMRMFDWFGGRHHRKIAQKLLALDVRGDE